MDRTSILTEHLKSHDRDLFAQKERNGIINVMRKKKRAETTNFGDFSLTVYKDSADYVLSLTDTWTIHGSPADWGVEPILQRIKSIDIWNNPGIFEEMMKSYEKDSETKDRDRKNDYESFLKDFRKPFARAFNGINTSGMKDRRI